MFMLAVTTTPLGIIIFLRGFGLVFGVGLKQ
jgi:hypothetical protein